MLRLTRLLSLWAVVTLRLRLRAGISTTTTELSLALPRAFASWGILPVCGLRLAACSDGPEQLHTGYLIPSVHWVWF